MLPAKPLEIVGFLRFVYRRWTEDRCPMIAGSLTYTTLLALVPTFLVAVAVMSSLPFFDELMTKFKIFLQMNLVPELANTIITVYMAQFSANAAQLTTVSLIVVLGVAVWLMLDLDASFNAIWRVQRSRPYWVSVLGYAVLLLVGPVLIALSVSATTYAMSLSAELGDESSGQASLLRTVPAAISAVFFFLLYKVIPNRHVPWRHALLGGTVAALLFESAKEFFRIYVHHSTTNALMYGALAFVPILLAWIYLSWLVILFGAELTASAAYWNDGRWKKPTTPAMRFGEAVEVTRCLIEADDRASLSFDELMQGTRLPAAELEDTLSQMISGGVVRRVDAGYALTQGTREVLMRPAARPEAPRLKPGKRGKARSGRSSR